MPSPLAPGLPALPDPPDPAQAQATSSPHPTPRQDRTWLYSSSFSRPEPGTQGSNKAAHSGGTCPFHITPCRSQSTNPATQAPNSCTPQTRPSAARPPHSPRKAGRPFANSTHACRQQSRPEIPHNCHDSRHPCHVDARHNGGTTPASPRRPKASPSPLRTDPRTVSTPAFANRTF